MPVRNMFGTLYTSESMRYLEDDMDGVLMDIITWMTTSLPRASSRVAWVKSIPLAFHDNRMPLRPKAAYKRPRWHLRIYEIDADASFQYTNCVRREYDGRAACPWAESSPNRRLALRYVYARLPERRAN